MNARLIDKFVTVDFTMPELEALLKTVGIAINNLMSKSNRVGADTHIGRAASDELVVLSGIQQELLGVLVECSTDDPQPPHGRIGDDS